VFRRAWAPSGVRWTMMIHRHGAYLSGNTSESISGPEPTLVDNSSNGTSNGAQGLPWAIPRYVLKEGRITSAGAGLNLWSASTRANDFRPREKRLVGRTTGSAQSSQFKKSTAMTWARIWTEPALGASDLSMAIPGSAARRLRQSVPGARNLYRRLGSSGGSDAAGTPGT